MPATPATRMSGRTGYSTSATPRHPGLEAPLIIPANLLPAAVITMERLPAGPRQAATTTPTERLAEARAVTITEQPPVAPASTGAINSGEEDPLIALGILLLMTGKSDSKGHSSHVETASGIADKIAPER